MTSWFSAWWYGTGGGPAPARNAYTNQLNVLQPVVTKEELAAVKLQSFEPPAQEEGPVCPFLPGSALAEMWQRFQSQQWVRKREQMV